MDAFEFVQHLRATGAMGEFALLVAEAIADHAALAEWDVEATDSMLAPTRGVGWEPYAVDEGVFYWRRRVR